MQDAKHILASKTFWVHILTLAVAVASTCRGNDWIAEHPKWMQSLIYFSSIAGVVLRWLTTKPVTIQRGGM